MQPMRQSLPIILATVSIACAAVATEPAEQVSAETIAKLIEQLDSDIYIERERATIVLGHIGGASIEALTKAADGNRLEVATRAVRVLLKYSEHDDANLSQAALGSIATLKNRPVESAAAQAMLDALREKQALAEVLRLGGTKDEDRARFDGFGPDVHLKIGAAWKGGDAGLEQVGYLQSLLTLNIHATPITDKGLTPHIIVSPFEPAVFAPALQTSLIYGILTYKTMEKALHFQPLGTPHTLEKGQVFKAV